MTTPEIEQTFETSTNRGPATQSACSRESYDDRLNHILRAATTVIARDGYQKASMREVAREAGVSLAGIYHYFESKQKMLFVIQFRSFSSLQSRLQERLYGVSDPVEQLQVFVRAYVNYFASNLAAQKVCSHEMDSLSGSAYDEIRTIRRQYYTSARAIIDRIFETHDPNNGLDRRVATMLLFSMLNWLYRWYDPKKDRSPTSLANQISSQFLHGVIGLEDHSSLTAYQVGAEKDDDQHPAHQSEGGIPSSAAESAPLEDAARG